MIIFLNQRYKWHLHHYFGVCRDALSCWRAERELKSWQCIMFNFGRNTVVDIFVWCFSIARLSPIAIRVLTLLKYSAIEMWFHHWSIICATSFVQGQIITYRNCQPIHTVKVTFFSCPYKDYGCENCNYFLDDMEKLYSVDYVQRAVAL